MNGFADKYRLSRREMEVVESVTKGLSNKLVAQDLFVTEKTIKFHLTNIFKKAGVNSRSRLIVKYNAAKYAAPAGEPSGLLVAIPIAI